jgi:catechol 2,3-dioxygenase-like lactoylglutathione lyase family enzyme
LTTIVTSTILIALTDVDVTPEVDVSRIQLALNVSSIDRAVDFYSKLLGAEPAKRRPGYANFVVADPPLKLVLIEVGNARGAGVAGSLNHLGVEVASQAEVRAAAARLTAEGMSPDLEESTTCCYALQDKAWVTDPDGARWEVYTVLADAPDESGLGCSTEACVPADDAVAVSVGADNGARSACC